VHGKDQNRDVGEHRAEILDEFQAGLAGQGHIHQYQVGLLAPHGIERSLGVACFATDDQVRLLGNQLRQAMACQRMIVHQ